ncbi:MAG: hypothetical protein ABIM44_09255 [candidate division WOR-3 bacterium]
MPAVTVYLSDDIYEIVKWVSEKEKMKRNQAIAYIIRMSYIYRYKILEEEEAQLK